MAALATDGILDATLDKIAEGTTISVLSDAPAEYADIATYTLASVSVTPGDGNGDFTIANGDVSGRKVTITAQNDIEIEASGNATHVSIDNGTDYIVTTCTTKALTDGDKVNIPAFKIELADPVAS